MNEKREERSARDRPEERRDSGVPGGGAGRKDEVGGSGVHPASAGDAPPDSVIRTPAAWGQGDRGAAGYEDSGDSELFFYDAELRAADSGPEDTERAAEDETGEEETEHPDRRGR